MLRLSLLRIFLVGGCLAYLVALAITTTGQWVLDHPTPANLQRGIQWNPGNGLLWVAYARQQRAASLGFGSPEAVQAYLRAAALNPLDPAVWEGLGAVYLQLGEQEKAEAAMQAELIAMPHSPQAAWRLANFLLFQDRIPEALPYLKTAATYDRQLRFPTFEMAWKLLPTPEAILHDVVPATTEARQDYLSFLIDRGKLLEAFPVWEQVQPNRTPVVLSLGYTYVDALAGAGFGDQAARLWGQLLDMTGRAEAKPEGEWLTNGDFEANLPNAGLDWRFAAGPGYTITLDHFISQRGSRSLRVDFDGGSNPDFLGMSQIVPVQPNTRYRFQGYIKTENISTDSGLFFWISSFQAPVTEQFTRATENRIGTSPWSLEQVEFRTGPQTRLLRLGLRRLLSKKLNNLLQGKVWVDNLSLTRLPG